jgi:hypothetical protein
MPILGAFCSERPNIIPPEIGDSLAINPTRINPNPNMDEEEQDNQDVNQDDEQLEDDEENHENSENS